MPVYAAGQRYRRFSSLRPAMNIFSQAAAILAKYGGSLWVADPAYTFTSSDGTGAASDGSDTGYVRDLCATLGPELSTVGMEVAHGNGVELPIASGLVVGKMYSILLPAGCYVKFGPGWTTTGPVGIGEVVNRIADGSAMRILNSSGSTINYTPTVREIIGRPLFQSTTSFKPKLKRVPKRLGPELVTNGDFANNTTGWNSFNCTLASVAGELEVTATSVTNPQAYQSVSVSVGRTYAIGASYRRGTAENNAQVLINNNGAYPTLGANTTTTNATYSTTLVADAAQISVIPIIGVTTTGKTAYFDNISVREVLEWGWAWVFDGTDDLLATVSQPAITGETFIAASKIATASVAAAQALMSKRTDINGSFLRRETTGATAASVVQADGVFRPAPLRSPDVDLSRHVYTQKITASLNVARLDGVQSGQIGCAPNPVATSIQIGAVLAARLNGEIYAAAYAPAAIPDAELLIIERAMAQLGGITI